MTCLLDGEPDIVAIKEPPEVPAKKKTLPEAPEPLQEITLTPEEEQRFRSIFRTGVEIMPPTLRRYYKAQEGDYLKWALLAKRSAARKTTNDIMS